MTEKSTYQMKKSFRYNSLYRRPNIAWFAVVVVVIAAARFFGGDDWWRSERFY